MYSAKGGTFIENVLSSDFVKVIVFVSAIDAFSIADKALSATCALVDVPINKGTVILSSTNIFSVKNIGSVIL